VTAGALDTRFAGLAERMAAAIGANATVALIPDAGHAAHLEQPEAFVAVLRRWLAAEM
jgi:pimeloyl-ACP methyl ester carboxylesterase